MIIGAPWWGDAVLDEAQRMLLVECLIAHAQAALVRDTLSGAMVRGAATGSGDFWKAMAAGMMSMGGTHAPIVETGRLLQSPISVVKEMLLTGKTVPGWGHDFHKDAPDPVFSKVQDLLSLHFPVVWEKVNAITQMMHAMGRKLWPNPAAYTAAVAIALGIPLLASPWLVLAGRLGSWSQIAAEAMDFNHRGHSDADAAVEPEGAPSAAGNKRHEVALMGTARIRVDQQSVSKGGAHCHGVAARCKPDGNGARSPLSHDEQGA